MATDKSAALYNALLLTTVLLLLGPGGQRHQPRAAGAAPTPPSHRLHSFLDHRASSDPNADDSSYAAPFASASSSSYSSIGEHGNDDATGNNELSQSQLVEIRSRIISSLGLSREPDLSELNVTESEMAEAYRQYYDQIRGTAQAERELQHMRRQQQRQEQHKHHHHHHHHNNNNNNNNNNKKKKKNLRHQNQRHPHHHRVLARDIDVEEGRDEESDEEENAEPLATQQVFSYEATNVSGISEIDEFVSTRSVSFPLDMSFTPDIPRNSNVTSVVLRLFKTIIGEGGDASVEFPVQLATFYVYHVTSGDEPQMLVATQRVPVRGDEWETVDLSFLLASWSWTEPLHVRVECLECQSLNLSAFVPQSNVVADEFSSSSSSSSSMNASDAADQGERVGNLSRHSANASTRVTAMHGMHYFGPTLDLRVASYGSDNSLVRRRRWTPEQKKEKKQGKKKQTSKSSPESSSNLSTYDRTWQGTAECSKGEKGRCCRHRMYVNFTLLNMSFIVEPKGFEAYYCKGKCLMGHNPAHTHALIQSTMNSFKKAPRPCCAPSKLSNLTLLHYDEQRKLKVTHWANAVVEECACS